MKEKTNLLDIINGSDDEVNEYLEVVTTKDFREDVLRLSRMNVNKVLAKELIDKLQEMIKDE